MFDEEMFLKAIDQPRLQGRVPQLLDSNRAEPIRVYQEPELQARTKQWFVDFDRKLEHYSTHFGTDLSWVMTWAKKYWWSFLVRDMDLNHELYAPDITYRDVSTFGHTIVGIDEFVKYNFASFEAIPDWGTTRFPIRSTSTSHPRAPCAP